jgi:hypothetical protein
MKYLLELSVFVFLYFALFFYEHAADLSLPFVYRGL